MSTHLCPSPEQLERLLAEQLSDPEREAVAGHVEGCAACREALARLTEDASHDPWPPSPPPGSSPAFLDELARSVPPELCTPQPATDTPGPPGATPPPGARLRVLGYEVLEELGRGGMGVVYKARHEALQRLVALKVLLAGEHAAPAQLARFRAEAEALARLQHPHIVQVYEVGEHGGLPFFALELVDGTTLAGRLGGAPQPAREAARLVEELARAIHAAHQQGVIHRDLKPANILLAADGTAKISDFGLAKRVDVVGVPTQSGEVVGTPPYMAPEQARGDRPSVGPASDVYALGAILYELLTGRPPFRAVTPLDTLLQVLYEEPVPPRRLQPKVPRDLETICLKCLSKAPEQRYPTAEALAEDLRRWRNGEPIRAQPVSQVERAWRWCRRNPLVAGLTAAIVLLVVATTFTTTALAILERRKAADTEQALKREEALGGQLRNALAETEQAYGELSDEQERAKAALAEALKRRKQYRDALDGQTSFYLEKLLALQQVVTEEHEQFLRQALKSYEALLTEVGQDEEARTNVAAAHARVGGIRARLGLHKEAEPAYDRAIALFKQLAAEFPKPAHQRLLAITHNDLGIVLNATGRLEKAEGEFRAALTLQEPLVANFPKVPEYRHDLTATRSNLADLLRNTGRLPEAEGEYRAALDLDKELVADFPEVPEYRQDLAGTHNNLGVVLQNTERSQQAEREFQTSLAIRKELVKEFPKVPAYRRELAASHTGLGAVCATTGRPQDAETHFRAAFHLGKQLADRFPTVPEYRRELAGSHNNLGSLLAEAEFRAAIERGKQLVADFNAVPDYHNELAATMLNLAHLHHDGKEFQSARQLLDEALPHHQAALKANHQHPEYRQFYRNNRWLQVLVHLPLGDHRAASATAEQLAEAALDPVHDTFNAVLYLVSCVPLAEKDNKLDEAERKKLVQQYGDRALKLLRQAMQNGFKDVQRLKKDPGLAPLRSRADFQELVGELEKKLRPN